MSLLDNYKDHISWAILLAGIVAGLVFGVGWLFMPSGSKGGGKRPRVEQTQQESKP